jgi:CheY-like chemotaxis protein
VENFPSPARRILVVDDYGDSADTLAELLGFDGNDVRVAHDGLEALEIAENFRPRVALLDLGMPKLNGYETASKIREQPWGEKMFLVAVTGWGEEAVMERTKEAGFDAHILKPVDYSKLSKLLADFLSRDVPVDVAKD